MCAFCQNLVDSPSARMAIATLAAIFIQGRVNPSDNLAVALRMIARQSQSREYHDLVERHDAGLISDADFESMATDTFYVQAAEYAESYGEGFGTSFDRTGVLEVRAILARLFYEADVDLSNALAVAMLTISDIMLEFGQNPPTQERFNSMVDANIAMFNATKTGVQ